MARRHHRFCTRPTLAEPAGRRLPCHLRVRWRNRLKPAQWTDLLGQLRTTGRNPLLIAENTSSNWLTPFDGEFDYASSRSTVAEIFDFDRRETSRVRTYNLLGDNAGPRRIWAATVSPGYDDTRLADGRQPRVTDSIGRRLLRSAVERGAQRGAGLHPHYQLERVVGKHRD